MRKKRVPSGNETHTRRPQPPHASKHHPDALKDLHRRKVASIPPPGRNWEAGRRATQNMCCGQATHGAPGNRKAQLGNVTYAEAGKWNPGGRGKRPGTADRQRAASLEQPRGAQMQQETTMIMKGGGRQPSWPNPIKVGPNPAPIARAPPSRNSGQEARGDCGPQVEYKGPGARSVERDQEEYLSRKYQGDQGPGAVFMQDAVCKGTARSGNAVASRDNGGQRHDMEVDAKIKNSLAKVENERRP
ncbi:hypothetical protein B0H16DRAFT_1687144 [Mycena metata]|uniref:Uncharacterized protein n=1 Tax=Mycena metata TaxID=1033252 RepID=A0AAD7NLG6_9AGAR|nr:hypothetical protein B0H16DRAFT_1687144 [Mycena metata]